MLGGLTGRLDQTIHTLSYLHKLRKTRKKVYAITDENVGWVLDSVSCICLWHIPALLMHTVKGEHTIEIDHDMLGKTCGLLPIGVASTVLSTTGLQWNLGVYINVPS